MSAPDPAVLRTRIDAVWNRIVDAGGHPDRVTLLAVTKGFGPEVAVAAAQAGLTHLGENYAQEVVAKAPIVAELIDGSRLHGSRLVGSRLVGSHDVQWHFIGQLQRNKVRSLAPVIALWQTVDRLSLGLEIAKRAPTASILVQVNVSDEPQKGGCLPADAPKLVHDLTEAGLHVGGLMTVGRTGSPDDARAGFRALSVLADELDLPIRSMGMSGDLEVAVREGSTMVRVGSALFGPRPSVPGGMAGPR